MAKLLKADPSRRVSLEGVGPVPRPVDIDQTQTAFEALRTLRIYHFEPPGVIEGHAEEDEVFIVALSGSADLVIRSDHWSNSATCYSLSAPIAGCAVDVSTRLTCAAYLPPHAEYALTPRTGADIAYVRATPKAGRPPAILRAAPSVDDSGVRTLINAGFHAERLRMRLLQIDAGSKIVSLAPIPASDGMHEALIHLRTQPLTHAACLETASAASVLIESWDTFAVAPREIARLHVSERSSALCLVVTAR